MRKYCHKPWLISLTLGILTITLGYGIDIRFLTKKLETAQKQLAITQHNAQLKKQAMQSNHLKEPPSSILVVPLKPTSAIDILHDLDKSMRITQVMPSLFEPQLAEDQGSVVIYPIKLEIKGEYQSSLAFINLLLCLPDWVVVEELELQKKTADETDNLNMRLFLKIYKSKNNVAKNMDNLSIPVPKRDIFKPNLERRNLALWSSQELKFLGIVKEAGKILGVVSDPLGSIYRVTEGDKIGLHQSKIIKITRCGITTDHREDQILGEEKCI